MFDKVLTIPQPEHLGQTTGWFCGPATCQTTLQILGDFYEEEQLANEMGTTQDGTNHIGLLANCLNLHAHHAKWEAVFIENDPMNADQKEKFWTHLTASLTAGFPCPMNWVAPPGGTPIAVDPNTGQPTAEQPGYSNSYTTFHYVLARGAIENDRGRFVAVADSGFWPQQYYVKFEGQGSATSLIPPKGYCWASAAPIGVPTLPGPVPPPPAPAPAAPASGATPEVLSKSMWDSLPMGRYQQLFPAMVECLRQAECTNENRVAFLLANVAHETAGLVYSEEIASGEAYEGREDLGNVEPGWGVKYKGRGWLQLTGAENYRQFSQWAFDKGIAPTPTHFFDHPELVADDKYVGLSTSWYWTVARSDINSLCDANDFTSVVMRINGGTTGLADREARLVVCREVAPAFLTSAPPAPAVPGQKPHPAPTGDACLDELIGAAPHHATVLGEYGANPYTAYTVQDKLSHVARENTMWLPARTLGDILRDVIEDPDRADTVLGHSINAASLARVNFELLRRICDHLKIDTKDVI